MKIIMLHFRPMTYFNHYSLVYSPYANNGLAGIFVPLILAAVLWTVVLKGFSLWYAARGEQKWWFIALLVINTLGILEIVYLLFFRPKQTAPMTSSSAQ